MCLLVCTWIAAGTFPDSVGVPGHGGVAHAAGPAGTVPVYRLMSNANNEMHVYTADAGEKDYILSTWPWAWTYEGVAYYTPEGGAAYALPVYRFWSKITGAHFFTISESERNKVETQMADTWVPEGPVFYAYPDGVQPTGTRPVYRFWSAAAGCHFFTMSTSERDKLQTTYASRWTYEGVVGESDENNNAVMTTSQFLVPGGPLPDLIWDYLLASPSFVRPGGFLMVSRYYFVYTVSPNENFTIEYRFSTNEIWGDGDDVLLGPSETISAPADKTIGGPHMLTWRVDVPSSTPLGLHYLMAKLDSGNVVAESNENNNVRYTAMRLRVY